MDSEYRRPLDVVRQYARERWNLQLEDLIVLTSSGTLLSNDSKDMPEVAEVYFFTKQCLETQVRVCGDTVGHTYISYNIHILHIEIHDPY